MSLPMHYVQLGSSVEVSALNLFFLNHHLWPTLPSLIVLVALVALVNPFFFLSSPFT